MLLTLGAALVIGTGCATLLGIEPVPAAPDGGGGPPPEEAATTDAPSSLDDDAGEAEIDGGCIDFRGPELDAGVLCAAGPNGRCGRGETCCSQEDRMAISCTATEDACPVGADRTEAWVLRDVELLRPRAAVLRGAQPPRCGVPPPGRSDGQVPVELPAACGRGVWLV